MMWLGEYILPEITVIVQSRNVTIHATFQEPINHYIKIEILSDLLHDGK
jgi:hypothetical protein